MTTPDKYTRFAVFLTGSDLAHYEEWQLLTKELGMSGATPYSVSYLNDGHEISTEQGVFDKAASEEDILSSVEGAIAKYNPTVAAVVSILADDSKEVHPVVQYNENLIEFQSGIADDFCFMPMPKGLTLDSESQNSLIVGVRRSIGGYYQLDGFTYINRTGSFARIEGFRDWLSFTTKPLFWNKLKSEKLPEGMDRACLKVVFIDGNESIDIT